MSTQTLLPHLFRTEFRKLVAVLSRHFGLQHLETAEDIASDAFLQAAESWPLAGIPENPTGWLYTVARNKARDFLRKQQRHQQKLSELRERDAPPATLDLDLSPQAFADSQLQMLFAVCHPTLPENMQVGLALRILCGFGIEEIAEAFLTNKATINKRLARGKARLRQAEVALSMPPEPEMGQRLGAVLTTIYLLFNEGYFSSSNNLSLRKDLCREAIRLAYMLTHNPSTNTPKVNALLALMCFHSSRFAARMGSEGEWIRYEDQDSGKWDQELIDQGRIFLGKSAEGQEVSRYHLEAAIALHHTEPESRPEKWQAILQLYNRLLQIAYSPAAALNRTYALFRSGQEMEAIAQAEKLDLSDSHLYHALLARLWRSRAPEKSRIHLQQALDLAKTKRDRQLLQAEMDRL